MKTNILILYACLPALVSDAVAVYGPSSITVKCSCTTLERHRICCDLVGESAYHPRLDGLDRLRRVKSLRNYNLTQCTENRTYYPSPYEEMNFKLAIQIQEMPTSTDRHDALKTLYQSPENYRVAEIWLNRIKERMFASDRDIIENDVDWKYLSRFHIELHCGSRSYSWNEWIEPLTVHNRHPNFFRGRMTKSLSVDYVLLKSSASHYNNSLNMKQGHATKHFLLDAGSSTFESSLLWFTCGYKQVNYIHMNVDDNIIYLYCITERIFL